MKKLFSRKSSGEAVEQGGPKEIAGLSIARLNLIAMMVALLVLLISAYAAYLQFASQVSSRESDARGAEARVYAAQLSGRLQAMGEELARLATADAPLLAAIAAEDGALLRQREQQLAGMLPQALRIRYLLPSEQDPDDSLVPRLSYACLDMARRAEQGGTPPFEVHLLGSEHEHIDMIRPVRDGDTAVASLMVSLAVSELAVWMEVLKPQGYLELRQGTGAEALLLASAGNAAHRREGSGMSAAVAGSGWQLHYWPANGIGMAEAHQAGFMMTFAVAAGLLLLFFILFNLFLANFLRRDLKRMVDFIVDSSLGKRFHSYPVKLAESKQVLQEKEMYLAVLSSHASVVEKGRHDEVRMEIPELTFANEEGGKAGKGGIDDSRGSGVDDSGFEK